jgi:hypothetical protein
MKFILLLFVLALPAIAADKDGYDSLFNGKNLGGWDGDPALWSVANGVIVGSSDNHPFTVNTFLVYKGRTFADFILKGDIKLRNHNSGIQFRSRLLPGPGWIVAGYQADASDVGDHSAWGNLYEERGRERRLMKVQDEGWQKAKAVLNRGDWNTYEILAQGPHIRLTLNGVVTIDTEDTNAARGVIALQMHAGQAMRVEFRNLRIKELR